MKVMKIQNINQSKDEEGKTKFRNNGFTIIELYSSFKNKKLDKMEYIAIFLNIFSFIFYFLSLEGCFKSQSKCVAMLSSMFLVRISIFEILSILISLLILFLIIYKKIKFYHLLFMVFYFFCIYKYDHGTKLDHHGSYNFIIYILLLVIFFIITGILILIINSFYKKKYIIAISICSIILFFLIKAIVFFNSFKNSCINWDKGLNETLIDNDLNKYDCKIRKPKKCLSYRISGIFDFSKFFFYCSENMNQEKEYKLFIKNLRIDKNLMSQSKLNHFGFPITVNTKIFDPNFQIDVLNLSSDVMSNVILMDLYNNNENNKYYNNSVQKPEVEFFYDKKKKQRKLFININKNETLSEIRNNITKNLAIKNNNSKYKNILFIYLDAVSRPQFLRKLPKTSKFIEKFMKNKNNNLGFNSFEFMKYQSFAHWTTPNVYPMFLGISENYRYGTSIIKYLKKQGYITAQTDNFCSKETFEIEKKDFFRKKIFFEDYDHENIAMFCDPTYFNQEKPYPFLSGAYANMRRCIFGKDSFKYVLNYGNLFWEKYLNNKKYLKLAFMDGHEATEEVIKYLDKYLFDFLNDFYEKGFLNDTVIFIASDHGNNMNYYFYYYIFKSDESFIEKNIGTLFIIVPNDDKNKLSEEEFNNIFEHQQSFITPFDIHDTLINVIFGSNFEDNSKVIYSKHGNSLFKFFDNKGRNCGKYDGIIRDGACVCDINMK